jgi:hypothetical protein
VHAPISTKGLTQKDIPELKEKVHHFMRDALKKEGYK